MADWEVLNIAVGSNGAWTKATAEAIAENMNGTVKMAYADLGITRVTTTNYWYSTIDIDTTQADVPIITWDGQAAYGLVGFRVGGYYDTVVKFVVMTLGETTAQYFANLGAGEGGIGTSLNVLVGEDFVAYKQTQLSTVTYNAVLLYAEVTDFATGNPVRVLMDNTNKLFDIDNGISLSSNDVPFTTYAIAQNDGTCYVEVVKRILYNDDHLYQADHIYQAVLDYDSQRDKTVLINGVKMNRMINSTIYIPVE